MEYFIEDFPKMKSLNKKDIMPMGHGDALKAKCGYQVFRNGVTGLIFKEGFKNIIVPFCENDVVHTVLFQHSENPLIWLCLFVKI